MVGGSKVRKKCQILKQVQVWTQCKPLLIWRAHTYVLVSPVSLPWRRQKPPKGLDHHWMHLRIPPPQTWSTLHQSLLLWGCLILTSLASSWRLGGWVSFLGEAITACLGGEEGITSPFPKTDGSTLKGAGFHGEKGIGKGLKKPVGLVGHLEMVE